MPNHTENKNCNFCIKRANTYFKSFKDSSDEDAKYTSFVFSLGYATMITFFTTIHKQMTIQSKATFMCLMLISIIPFIMNEIWKMLIGANLHTHKSKLWQENFEGKFDLEQLENKINEYILKQYVAYNKFYPFSFWSSLIFGISAAILLFSECLHLIF